MILSEIGIGEKSPKNNHRTIARRKRMPKYGARFQWPDGTVYEVSGCDTWDEAADSVADTVRRSGFKPTWWQRWKMQPWLKERLYGKTIAQ